MLPPIPALLADLVRLPSVNPMGRGDVPADIALEHRVTEYLEARLRELGVPVRRFTVAAFRDNLVAEYTPPTPPPFSIMFECHQDTVPVEGMVVDPCGGHIAGGKLYGRGACDVKAGAAAMLTAFARLVREKPPGSAAVTLAFTVDEEHGLTGVRGLVAAGVRADFAVVAEPTGLDIMTAHKGVAAWQLETAGVACHSSRPDRGVNAIYRMARLLWGVEVYAGELAKRPHDPALGPPTISAGVIHGGASANIVPDACRVELDRRLVPGESAAETLADLETFLRRFPGVDFPFV
ncbi:MAG: M20/M25/M40 family metallo-hydrolase, partial [Fimbriiglobus sp.]